MATNANEGPCDTRSNAHGAPQTLNGSDSANVYTRDGTARMFPLAEQLRRAIAVALVLEKAEGGSQQAVQCAHHVAAEIMAEAGQPQPNSRRLKKLLLCAIMAGADALAEQAATIDLIHLASHALQTI